MGLQINLGMHHLCHASISCSLLSPPIALLFLFKASRPVTAKSSCLSFRIPVQQQNCVALQMPYTVFLHSSIWWLLTTAFEHHLHKGKVAQRRSRGGMGWLLEVQSALPQLNYKKGWSDQGILDPLCPSAGPSCPSEEAMPCFLSVCLITMVRLGHCVPWRYVWPGIIEFIVTSEIIVLLICVCYSTITLR